MKLLKNFPTSIGENEPANYDTTLAGPIPWF